MSEFCKEAECGRVVATLCPGHLQAYILTVVSAVLEGAAEELMEDLAPDEEED